MFPKNCHDLHLVLLNGFNLSKIWTHTVKKKLVFNVKKLFQCVFPCGWATKLLQIFNCKWVWMISLNYAWKHRIILFSVQKLFTRVCRTNFSQPNSKFALNQKHFLCLEKSRFMAFKMYAMIKQISFVINKPVIRNIRSFNGHVVLE